MKYHERSSRASSPAGDGLSRQNKKKIQTAEPLWIGRILDIATEVTRVRAKKPDH